MEIGEDTYKKHVLWIQNVHFLTLVAGSGFEPTDLRVMGPTSYQTALPRDVGPITGPSLILIICDFYDVRFRSWVFS